MGALTIQTNEGTCGRPRNLNSTNQVEHQCFFKKHFKILENV